MTALNRHPIALLLTVALAFLWVGTAGAQLELGTPKRFNHLQLGVGTEPASPGDQPGNGKPGDFNSVGVTSASAGPISISSPKFPQSTSTDDQGLPVNTLQLRSARVGNSYANGVPRYFLGDEILPPASVAGGSAAAPPGYWRAKPVRPDESFANPNGTNLVDTAGNNLVSPAGPNGKPLPALGAGEYEKFYYSPHADRVFASQSGNVEVIWVTANPQPDVNGSYKFLKESFNVSGAATGEVRRIYWTEKSFDGPRVNIPAGRIARANPIYNANFPPEMDEYQPVGHVENPDPDAQPPEERRTLWFEKTNGNGQLLAYNREGRILVEYLGAETAPGRHEFLGADVVEVVQAAPSNEVTVTLGERVLPEDGDPGLTASPLLNLGAGSGQGFYGTIVLPDGRQIFHAERENLNPDRVVFYWLEDHDADVYLLPPPQLPGLSIRWPKFKNRYLFVWPDGLDEFAHVTTDPDGSGAETGIQFDSSSLPTIVFQDDAADAESRVDSNTQRMIIDLSGSEDGWNRSLLRFTNGTEVWYVRVYTQAEDRSGYLEGDAQPAIDAGAIVGSRIVPPSERFSVAGAVTEGTGYQPSAYLDPYSVGVEAAEAGAIIPVNAVPGNDQLTVRWFEKIEPPSATFAPFYVPSKVGRYTVSYPGDLGAWRVAQPSISARGWHTATLLQDGRVLIASGFSSTDGSLGTAELYDPATGVWESTAEMETATWGRTATRLASGKVLVAGGAGQSAAELFDPATGTWTAVAPMAQRRGQHQATLLADGRVLVTGGRDSSALASCEIYDPAAGTWSSAPRLRLGRMNHTATLLEDGRVLVVGGVDRDFGTPVASAELYDPAAQTWSAANLPAEAREWPTATRLPDGRVLLAGGRSGLNLPFGGLVTLVPGADASPFYFDAGAWKVDGLITDSTSTLDSPVMTVTADGPVELTLSHDRSFEPGYDGGRVLVSVNGGPYVPPPTPFPGQIDLLLQGENIYWTGTVNGATDTATLFEGTAGDTFRFRFEAGWDVSIFGANPNWTIIDVAVINGTVTGTVTNSDTAEIYDPVGGAWSATANPLTAARFRHAANLMPDGKVLVTGAAASTDLFDPETGTWSAASPLAGSRQNHTSTLLANGELLVAGGYNNGSYIRSAEILEAVSTLVMASNRGTDDLTSAQAAGSIYVQNDAAAIGYNPNEEHAIKRDNRFWALRDDLNITGDPGYSSEPFVLVSYTDPEDGRPAMRPFKVLREDTRYKFDYPWTAGSKIQGPMPMPLLALPVGDDGRVANTEVPGTPDPAPAASAPAFYDSFTFEDRQGYKWVYRGPHAAGGKTLGMQWYYPMQTGFFLPGLPLGAQPEVGTTLPYLRPLGSTEDPITGTPLTVIYRPAWPRDVPTMRVAETLTLPKFGLPDVRNQKSAEVFYEQSVATGGEDVGTVILHDPTRQKSLPLTEAGLAEIPASIRTSNFQGKTYFQGLPPHLQQRFFLDPLASSSGSLILRGEFHDEVSGEDFLDLNVLSPEDEAALASLAVNEPADVQATWANAIAGLKTRLETFIEDPARRGTYIVDPDPSKTFDVASDQLAELPDADTARDSYALTASGIGEGYVTLVFSNGVVPGLTPPGDPPVVQIIQVIPELYNGDLKVRLSSNPLDEQVTLRHSGDFAARPGDYEFEWRYAQPIDGVGPKTYDYTSATYLGDPGVAASRQWRYARNPAQARPDLDGYSVPPDLWTLGDSQVIADSDYDPAGGLPGVALRANASVDFSAEIPADITFSADLGSYDGFVLYVNGAVALVHGNGVPALDGLLLESAYDLLLKRAGDVGELPAEGQRLLVIAEIDDALYFRAFDGAGEMVVDADEGQLGAKGSEIAGLKDRLAGLWATTNLESSVKSGVIEAAASILAIIDFSLDDDGSARLSATGLSKQFAVGGNFFLKGPNVVEVGLYSAADPDTLSALNFRLEGASKIDRVADTNGDPISPWNAPSGILPNNIVVGGSPTAPLGSPLLVMQDNYFTMRYRPKEGVNFLRPVGSNFGPNDGWSDWTRPALVEGWIKRVLAAINPFNQRVKDLFNNAVNTDVSLLTQAGGRWEGDVALTLDAIDDFGLIAIYETVLNRGKEISIDSGYDNGGVNDALLLAAGYLNDLYTILGNEAFADAANPTISIDDQDSATEINTSRYSFEGQVASVLDEELALLRGRDDFLNPQVTQSPFYNRLFWNYTRGINSGEALYATNYNIKEKVGSSTEDGSIDAADAARMFPQGHGDAYGHYLTALKGYYKLLTNPNFTWQPRIEALNILGNTVAVDYQDERKFAETAANVARTAEQVIALTFRQQYSDDPAAGWEQFRDGQTGGEFNSARHFGLDEWTSRSTQGAYYHWAVGNAQLPDADLQHTGIQKIDRTTVPELELLAVSGESFQTTIDNANSHLNPLGLSPGAIAFDIDPAELRAGNSHYEQVYQRALGAVLNAKGSFDQAAKMTRLLRNQENQIDEFNTAIEDEERGFQYKLTDLYGSPYPGDVGPGKTYAQGYSGADLNNWFVVDRPTQLIDPAEPITIQARVLRSVPDFEGFGIMAINQSSSELFPPEGEEGHGGNLQTYEIQPSRFVQFSDQWRPGVDLGKRSITGRIQQALIEDHLAYIELIAGNERLQDGYLEFDRTASAFVEAVEYHERIAGLRDDNDTRTIAISAALVASKIALKVAAAVTASEKSLTEALAEGLPTSIGTSNDTTFSQRLIIRQTNTLEATVARVAGISAEVAIEGLQKLKDRFAYELARDLEALGFGYEERLMAYEFEVAFQAMLDRYIEIAQLALLLQQATEEVRTVMALGDRLQLEREIFRKRAATVVQGYRTNDLTFRAFRNEALEQYRTLFDLAGRYTYLAAKSYDYETGLLGTDAGQAVIDRIVAARSLGDLAGGQPQATVSTLGDAGLAGTMAQLQADWAVAEGRLGINNPDQSGTLFSLRHELFRIMDDPSKTEDDTAWRQTLEQHMISDLMSDTDVAANCRNLRKPDGSAVPGIVIPFSTTIEHGKNFFGLPAAGGDHGFSPSNFATKIYAAGVVLEGYIGMDPYAEFIPGAGEPATNDPNSLMATPYLYLIPTGVDKMLAPPLGDGGSVRSWTVHDQALPLPYNLGANAFSTTQFFDANGTLTEQPWILRKHQAFRPVDDPVFFYSGLRDEFDSSRLIGRSVWNTGWKIVIPAYGLLNDEQEGLDRFAATVDDIKLFLRTYSHSGN